MADLFREIEEDLRAERLQRMWRRHNGKIIGAACAIIVAIAGYSAWDGYMNRRHAAEGDRFAAALAKADQGDPAGAATAMQALAKEGSAGYALLARFSAAGLAVTKGEIDTGLAQYDAIAADGAVDRIYRDLATLLAGFQRVDKEDAAAFKARLAPVAADGNPWRFVARELIALSTLSHGDKAEARKALTALSDDAAAPQGVRARAAELLASLGPA